MSCSLGPPCLSTNVMQFKANRVTNNPDYAAIKQRSESLALTWVVGRAFFTIFVAAACVMPGVLVLVALIDPETLRGRALSVGGAIISACLLIAVIGFAATRYAKWKGARAH